MPVNLETRKTILRWLDERKLPYRFYEHDRADTIDDCLAMPFITDRVTICKNVFLCNRQKTSFYLMLLRPATPFRTAVVSKALGVSRLSFAPRDSMEALLHVTPGSVSPLGLVFDGERNVTLCYEAAVRETPEIAFHPCDNTATVVFSQSDFWEGVLPAMRVAPVKVENVL